MNGEYNYLGKNEKVKDLGPDDCYTVCPHCGKEYGRMSAFGKHIQEHKKNNTINWKFENESNN